MGKLVDLTGKTFGRLYVVGRAKDQVSPKGSKTIMWACICSCGGENSIKAIAGRRLVEGSTKSCGCIAREIHFKDLTGQRFGRWTVIEFSGTNNYRRSLWRCVCDCGTEKVVDGYLLRSGQSKSCGCYHRERITECNLIDLVGQRFGRLTVVARAANRGQTTYWCCVCDCGNIVEVHGSHLKSGVIRSCGCYNREVAAEQFTDLTNKRFGRWLVLERVGRDKHNKITWKCRCDCGNIGVVTSQALVSGSSTSCGCYKSEVMSKIHSGANNSNWKGGITSLRNTIRSSTVYHNWRKAIFERDNYTCQFSHVVGGRLAVHHIKPFKVILEENNITTWDEAKNCEELWDISNGITLLEEYHSFSSKNPISFHVLYSNFVAEKDFYKWFDKYSELSLPKWLGGK